MPIKKRFLLLIAMMWMHFASTSQTIDSNRIQLQTHINNSAGSTTTKNVGKSSVSVQDSLVSIPKSQAIKVILDLEYLRMLKQQDSLLQIDTLRFSLISKEKDTVITLLKQENVTLNGVISNQNAQQSLAQNQIKSMKKSTFWIKVERDVAIGLAILLGGVAIFK